MRRLVVAVSVLAVAAGLAASGWWAARATLSTPEDPLATTESVTYQVVEQTVERTQAFVAVAEWPLSPGVRNGAAGTVTAVEIEPGDTVSQGDILYSVNLRPTVAVVGSVPSFRDLQQNDKGPDVVQLQTLLLDLGFLEGEPDGEFGAGTRRAVREWQEGLGVENDGIVRRGDVLFFPELPRKVVPSEAVKLGAAVVGGEVAMFFLGDGPDFWIPLATDQRSLVPLSAAVLISNGDEVWEARIDRVEEDTTEGLVNMMLTAQGGGSVCGGDCDAIVPFTRRTDFSAEIIVVPPTTGPVVPVAGLITGPSGQVSVRLANGDERAVTVRVTTGGLAVVDGVTAGEVIQLPFEEPMP